MTEKNNKLGCFYDIYKILVSARTNSSKYQKCFDSKNMPTYYAKVKGFVLQAALGIY